jgi:hypothetical protein
MKDYLHGCIVLAAKQAVSVPLFSRSSLSEHIEGSFNGSVGAAANFQCEIFDPVKGRAFQAGCSSALDDSDFHAMVSSVGDPKSEHFHGLRDGFHTSALEIPLSTPSVLYLEQRMPFGFLCLHSRHVDVHFFGLYNSKCSILYWSTVDNIEEILRTECPNEFWLHRFRPQKDFSLVLYVKRLCSRWYRWNETIPHPSQRFQALETSLINSLVHQTDGQQ